VILAAKLGADALGDLRDYFIGDRETVGLIQATEIVDGDQQEAARRVSVRISTSRARFISPVRGSKCW
jgi:hypothetical protein